MKGTNKHNPLLLACESYQQRKTSLLEFIKVSRSLIKTVNHCIETTPKAREICLEIIEQENKYIKSLINELIELKRWWLKEGKYEQERLLGRKTTAA